MHPLSKKRMMLITRCDDAMKNALKQTDHLKVVALESLVTQVVTSAMKCNSYYGCITYTKHWYSLLALLNECHKTGLSDEVYGVVKRGMLLVTLILENTFRVIPVNQSSLYWQRKHKRWIDERSIEYKVSELLKHVQFEHHYPYYFSTRKCRRWLAHYRLYLRRG